jgi:retinol dehydrogenase-12
MNMKPTSSGDGSRRPLQSVIFCRGNLPFLRRADQASLPALAGKTCVVTGASSGIGKAAATELARLGARVVLVCRDQARGAAALDAVRAAAPAGAPRLELARLDSPAEVRELAARLEELGQIDVLANNAGILPAAERRVTPDGLELTFAVNHLAPFLLTDLLLPSLRRGGGRVIAVSSDAHTSARFDRADPQLESGYTAWRAYANSKLANILFTRELARRTAGTGVTANCLHPGMVRTGLGRNLPPLLRYGFTAASPLMLSPRRGADTLVYLAASPEVADASGGYYIKRRERQPSEAARDPETARWLWQLSTELTGLTPAVPSPPVDHGGSR